MYKANAFSHGELGITAAWLPLMGAKNPQMIYGKMREGSDEFVCENGGMGRLRDVLEAGDEG